MTARNLKMAFKMERKSLPMKAQGFSTGNTLYPKTIHTENDCPIAQRIHLCSL